MNVIGERTTQNKNGRPHDVSFIVLPVAMNQIGVDSRQTFLAMGIDFGV